MEEACLDRVGNVERAGSAEDSGGNVRVCDHADNVLLNLEPKLEVGPLDSGNGESARLVHVNPSWVGSVESRVFECHREPHWDVLCVGHFVTAQAPGSDKFRGGLVVDLCLGVAELDGNPGGSCVGYS